MNKPAKIYHYTTLDKLVNYILPGMKLKMNSMGKMNDPFENLGHYRSRISTDLTRAGMAELVVNETFTTSFSVNKDSSIGSKLPRMWSQYGEQNRGVCLVLDYKSFTKENESVKFHDDYVDYDDYRIRQIPEPLVGKAKGSSDPSETITSVWNKVKSSEELIKKYFFVKHTNWESENEYRFLLYKEDAVDDIYLSIRDSLDKIILGIDFPMNYLPAIIELGVTKEMIAKVELEDSCIYRLKEL